MTTNRGKNFKSDVALTGVNCRDRLWVIQSFWSIFYKKITWYLKEKLYLDIGHLSNTPINRGVSARKLKTLNYAH